MSLQLSDFSEETMSVARKSVAVAGAAVLALTGSAAAAPAAPAGDTAARTPEAEWKLLYRTDNVETIKSMRVGGCVSKLNPTTGKVTVIVKALKPGESMSGTCVSAPVPAPPTGRTAAEGRDEDPGAHSEEFSPTDLPRAIEAKTCTEDGRSPAYWIVWAWQKISVDRAEKCSEATSVELPSPTS
jgi:hypothetical protein